MTIINNLIGGNGLATEVSFGDTPLNDAFGRLRVSEPKLLLDTKRVGSTPDNLMTNAVVGTGAVAYQANRSSTYLTVNADGDKATRQTRSRAIYQPGKSLMTLQTFVFATGETNVDQRVGYFDDNDGVFLQRTNGSSSIVRRTSTSGSAVDNDIPQASWNVDKMDGTGPSGITLDFTKTNILIMDYEWLGVGRVRFGFVVDGLIYYCHYFNNANTLDVVYMKNPNLPLRWEIEATGALGGAHTMEAICGSVSSEGGYDVTGITASADSGTTPLSLGAGVTGEVLAVRMQSGFTDVATAFIQSLNALCSSGANFRYRLVLNPTETAAGTWGSVNGSIMEKNTTRTVTADTGITLQSGYISNNSDVAAEDLRPVLTFGTTLAGVTDVFSLQITNLSGNESFYGALTWREVL